MSDSLPENEIASPDDLSSVNCSRSKLTHIDPEGHAQMVDVGQKPITNRSAAARAVCTMSLVAAEEIRSNASAKGDVLQVARLAAIGAAKRTDQLIPLCHTLPLDSIETRFRWIGPQELELTVVVQAHWRTGVEMEAMVAASIGALTVYDMCKAVDRGMRVSNIELISKSGGKSGAYQRSEAL